MKNWKKHLIPFVAVFLVALAGITAWRDHRKPRPDLTNNTTSRGAQIDSSQAVQERPPAFDKKKFSTTDPTSIWIVVNKQRPLNPQTYAPGDLVSVGGGQQMRAEAATALNQMFAAAKAEGLILSAQSGYRSYARQQVVYSNEVKAYGQTVADNESAKPGYSEHQTGWALDLGGGGCGIEDCFGKTKEGQWVATNGYKYGFVIRYPNGKESVTGYRYEPWHIRYVGIDLATEMHKQNVSTLEEFFNL